MPADIRQLPREEFIEKNLGLVHACAGRFKGRGIEYEELYAAGCLGLVKACDGFDTGRGVCFSTYAVPVILKLYLVWHLGHSAVPNPSSKTSTETLRLASTGQAAS